MAVAIGIGFWLADLHARTDRVIDTVLFRERHLAEQRLERVAKSLPHARSPAALNALVVDEPADALGSASAVFESNGSDAFERKAAVGWAMHACSS